MAARWAPARRWAHCRLFAGAAAEEPPRHRHESDPLHAALAEMDPDRLSPREALEALYRLKALLPVSASCRDIVRSPAMLMPATLPKAPEAAASILTDALAALANQGAQCRATRRWARSAAISPASRTTCSTPSNRSN